jgi:hypothetical protein
MTTKLASCPSYRKQQHNPCNPCLRYKFRPELDLLVCSFSTSRKRKVTRENKWLRHKPFHNNEKAHCLPSFLKRFKLSAGYYLNVRSSQSAKQKDCIMNYNTRAELLRTAGFFNQSCWKEKPFLQSPLNFAPGVVSQSRTKIIHHLNNSFQIIYKQKQIMLFSSIRHKNLFKISM